MPCLCQWSSHRVCQQTGDPDKTKSDVPKNFQESQLPGEAPSALETKPSHARKKPPGVGPPAQGFGSRERGACGGQPGAEITPSYKARKKTIKKAKKTDERTTPQPVPANFGQRGLSEGTLFMKQATQGPNKSPRGIAKNTTKSGNTKKVPSQGKKPGKQSLVKRGVQIMRTQETRKSKKQEKQTTGGPHNQKQAHYSSQCGVRPRRQFPPEAKKKSRVKRRPKTSERKRAKKQGDLNPIQEKRNRKTLLTGGAR